MLQRRPTVGEVPLLTRLNFRSWDPAGIHLLPRETLHDLGDLDVFVVGGKGLRPEGNIVAGGGEGPTGAVVVQVIVVPEKKEPKLESK